MLAALFQPLILLAAFEMDAKSWVTMFLPFCEIALEGEQDLLLSTRMLKTLLPSS